MCRSIPSNAIPLPQELGEDVRASKSRSTGDLDDRGHKVVSQNRPNQETAGRLTKTSLEVMDVRYRKKRWVWLAPQGSRLALLKYLLLHVLAPSLQLVW